MVWFLSKKNPLPALGAGNGFFLFLMVKLYHYQPLYLAGDNNYPDEYENKADKAVNGK